MYPAIIIPPIASICKNPNCVATRILKKPITEAEPSFIEFLASVLSEEEFVKFSFYVLKLIYIVIITISIYYLKKIKIIKIDKL
jgi:hypothetical protein